MDNCRVLIISNQLLFTEALIHVVESTGGRGVVKVNNMDMALPFLKSERVETIIIVNQPEANLTEVEIVACLARYCNTCKVVFLTSTDNRMITYQRECIDHATPAHLIQAIGLTNSAK